MDHEPVVLRQNDSELAITEIHKEKSEGHFEKKEAPSSFSSVSPPLTCVSEFLLDPPRCLRGPDATQKRKGKTKFT